MRWRKLQNKVFVYLFDRTMESLFSPSNPTKFRRAPFPVKLLLLTVAPTRPAPFARQRLTEDLLTRVRPKRISGLGEFQEIPQRGPVCSLQRRKRYRDSSGPSMVGRMGPAPPWTLRARSSMSIRMRWPGPALSPEHRRKK